MSKFILVVISAIVLTACLPQQNACPEQLEALPSMGEAHMVWGGNDRKLTAAIVRVSAECIRVRPAKIKHDGALIENNDSYNIPVTARIAYDVIDKKWFSDATEYKDLDADIIFEAVSGSGVVLGSSKGTTRIISGGDSSNASGTIMNLSVEELEKTAVIYARWKYGRD